MFEGLNAEQRLLRILSAICKQSGGIIRLPLELVDSPGEHTKIDFKRDKKTQEFIVEGVKENEVLLESMRMRPEPVRPGFTTVDTAAPHIPAEPPPNGFTPSRSELSDNQLSDLEKKLQKRRIANMMTDELRNRKPAQQ
jgi:hypothetical protein